MRKSLSELRKTSGLTQIEVAKKLKVDQTTVSKWENGEALPRVEMLFMIARLYGVKVDNIKLIRAIKAKPLKKERNEQTNIKESFEGIWDQ